VRQCPARHTLNPWHDVEIGEDITRYFRAIIEIPRDSKIKYELDKLTGMLLLDRILHSAVHYPANYGFVPRTYCDDGDPLDVLVLGQEAVVPLCVLRARAIGVLTMRDEKGQDDKVIAVHIDDPEYDHYRDISELPPHRLKEIERFFADYKSLEGKTVDIDQMRGRVDAENVIRAARKLYDDGFGEAIAAKAAAAAKNPRTKRAAGKAAGANRAGVKTAAGKRAATSAAKTVLASPRARRRPGGGRT
jgi:inorganic pyrophosphatase